MHITLSVITQCRWAALLLTLLSGIGSRFAFAEVRLASPFTDHMVLQRECFVPVWGTADASEEVTVEFGGQKKSVRANVQRQWRVELDPLTTWATPQQLRVTGSNTPKPLICDDVLVGEVWLASGQSNMDFTVAKTEKFYFAGVDREAEEVAAANFPQIRMFTGEWTRSYEPATEIAGAWRACTPETVKEFSAVGYFFARKIHQELGIPVGIVTLTYGASTAQAWIRRSAIEAAPLLKPALDEFDAKVKAYVPLSEEESKARQAAIDQAKAAGQRPPKHPRPDPVQDQHNPTVMFNGMIAPVVPFAIRGFLWYQGESITGSRALFPRWNELLIKDWRTLWGPFRSGSSSQPLPFYFCQLASLDASSNAPEVRELQSDALELPDTAMAVTIDIGDHKNVHPKNKQDVGDRLARIALARNYGRSIEYSGPQYKEMSVEGSAIRLRFTYVDGGLVSKDRAPLTNFEVAGSDGAFLPADARIDGESVVLTNAKVSNPISARFAWSGYPEGFNFYNVAGLPAVPFRTHRESVVNPPALPAPKP